MQLLAWHHFPTIGTVDVDFVPVFCFSTHSSVTQLPYQVAYFANARSSQLPSCFDGIAMLLCRPVYNLPVWGPRKRFPHDTGIRFVSTQFPSEKEYTDERLCCFLRRMEGF